MSREIKFRAWDAKNNQMLCIFDSSTQASWFIPNYKDRYTVEQFTGLKDKNGVEIYEGAITPHHTTIVKGERIDSYAVVKWNNETASYVVYNPDDDTTEDLHNAHDWFEVCGNIHENPELLEK